MCGADTSINVYTQNFGPQNRCVKEWSPRCPFLLLAALSFVFCAIRKNKPAGFASLLRVFYCSFFRGFTRNMVGCNSVALRKCVSCSIILGKALLLRAAGISTVARSYWDHGALWAKDACGIGRRGNHLRLMGAGKE